MRKFAILLLTMILVACGGSGKSMEEQKDADGKAIQVLFTQMDIIESNLKSLQKDIYTLSLQAKKAKSQSQKEEVASKIMKALNDVVSETKKLDDVKVPNIHNTEARNYINDVVVLQKEWGNNQRAKYLAAMQGNSHAAKEFQNEGDVQVIKIVMLYTKAAQSIGYEIKTDKK